MEMMRERVSGDKSMVSYKQNGLGWPGVQKYVCTGAGWDAESKGRAAGGGGALDCGVSMVAEASAVWGQV